jgi:hypothetical protein
MFKAEITTGNLLTVRVTALPGGRIEESMTGAKACGQPDGLDSGLDGGSAGE